MPKAAQSGAGSHHLGLSSLLPTVEADAHVCDEAAEARRTEAICTITQLYRGRCVWVHVPSSFPFVSLPSFLSSASILHAPFIHHTDSPTLPKGPSRPGLPGTLVGRASGVRGSMGKFNTTVRSSGSQTCSGNV